MKKSKDDKEPPNFNVDNPPVDSQMAGHKKRPSIGVVPVINTADEEKVNIIYFILHFLYNLTHITQLLT